MRDIGDGDGAGLQLKHVLEVDQFQRADLDTILRHARQMRDVAIQGTGSSLNGRILATLFYEPSTRTRLSFESAMLRLGGQMLSSEMAAETSSAVKGETIEDTVRIVESYADVIAIRHPVSGTAGAAASVSSVPILNAGDGAHEHPTQALLDLYTIQDELGRIDNLTVALVGDLRYGRAPRSLAKLLTRTEKCRIIMVSPPGIEMARDVLQSLENAGLEYHLTEDLDTALNDANVVYMTRVQKERFPSEEAYQAVQGRYSLTADMMSTLRRDAIVMHPLPRVNEIDTAVDSDPRAVYFRQARNGVYVRMALLDLLLNGDTSTLRA
jgi:aspartate carbamoyltransferase catalytic subunit